MAGFVTPDVFHEIISTKKECIIDIEKKAFVAKSNPYALINIPYEDLVGFPEKFLKKDENYYLICRDGLGAYRAAFILKMAGYTAYAIKGGYEDCLIAVPPKDVEVKEHISHWRKTVCGK